MPGSSCFFSDDVALWVTVSERRFRRGVGGGGSRLPASPKLTFQSSPLFQPSREAPASQVAKATAFLKSPLCAEALQEQLNKNSTSAPPTHRSFWSMYEAGQAPAEEKKEKTKKKKKKGTIVQEQSKPSSTTVRFSDDFHPSPVLTIDPKAATGRPRQGSRRQTTT